MSQTTVLLRRLTAALLLMAARGVAQPAFDVQHDTNLYGRLSQRRTDCPVFGCGPTSAVNSFAYLQNRFPDFYGGQLLPNGLTATANALMAPNYMNTACGSCGGTTQSDFILGKIAWFDDHPAPGGRTLVEAQTSIAWTNPRGPVPPGVQPGTLPGVDWLRVQLMAGQDVELFLDGACGLGCNHYVTLTGMTFDGLDGGLMSYIDPMDARVHRVGYGGLGAASGLSLLYEDPDTGDRREAIIGGAIAESPTFVTPEPTTLVSVATGLVLMALWLWCGGRPAADLFANRR